MQISIGFLSCYSIVLEIEKFYFLWNNERLIFSTIFFWLGFTGGFWEIEVFFRTKLHRPKSVSNHEGLELGLIIQKNR